MVCESLRALSTSAGPSDCCAAFAWKFVPVCGRTACHVSAQYIGRMQLLMLVVLEG